MSQQTDKKFELASNIIKKLKVSPSNNELLELYSLYKQATVGDCNIPQPSSGNFKDHYKWNAWQSKKGMSSYDAKEAYVKLALDLVNKLGI